jgi:hypothetical protein
MALDLASEKPLRPDVIERGGSSEAWYGGRARRSASGKGARCAPGSRAGAIDDVLFQGRLAPSRRHGQDTAVSGDTARSHLAGVHRPGVTYL